MPIRANTEAADALIEVWMMDAVELLRHDLSITRLIQRDISDIEADPYSTINVNVLGNLVARQKAEGSDVVSDSPTTGKVPVVLQYHHQVSWEVEGTAMAMANPGGIDYRRSAIRVLAEKIESTVLGTYADAGNVLGVAGTDLDEAALLAAKLDLSSRRCPRSGRVAVIHEEQENALLAIDKFTAADSRGDGGDALTNARIGRLHGFDIYASQLVAETSGPPITQHNLFFHPEGFLFAMRPLPLAPAGSGAMSFVIVDNEDENATGLTFRYEVSYNAKAQKMLHTIDVLYGVEIVDDRLVLEYQT